MNARGIDSAVPQLLIVEDERNIRELLRSHFEAEGYACVAAADGGAALAFVTGRPFDIIVLDLMLPGMDGLTLCRAIRGHGRNRETPVLMLTARREESDKLAGFGHGADDYLTKPFSMKELSCRVTALRRVSADHGRPVGVSPADRHQGAAAGSHTAHRPRTGRGDRRDTAGVPSALPAGIEPR